MAGQHDTGRLSEATLGGIGGGVRVPTYDRSTLPITVAHLGVGAFHRCHQAEYLDDLNERGAGHDGIVGINLFPPVLRESLGMQDGLYSRTLVEGTDRATRVIGAIRGVIDAGEEPDAAVAALARNGIATVTLTITEKGYCHTPATGELDETHAGILADLAGGTPPRSMPGLIVAALDARRDAGAGPVNLISCDNIPANGEILRRVVRRMAEMRQPDLVGWIDDNVAFPSTMVDRIVPATSAEDLAAVARVLGCEDHAAVIGEPFRQWVIEDRFRARRPRWEAAGVEIVADVRSREFIKMRVLNAAQTMFALYGALAGLEHTSDCVADAAILGEVEGTLRSEALPYLPRADGMEHAPYLAQSLHRIANRAIRHRCHQIATDTSQKIRQRILDPMRAASAAGQPTPGLTRAVAAWLAYLLVGTPQFGSRWQVSDPIAGRVAAIAAAHGGNLNASAHAILGIRDVFGNDLSQDDSWHRRVAFEVEPFVSRVTKAGTPAGEPARQSPD